MRKIAKPLGLIGVLTPLTVGALGVGDIELHSALNQNLIAQIPLVTSPSESASDIKVRLASPYAFTKAGIDRHYFLTGLRFNTEVMPNGQTVINITSRDAVREPFLNFLIEVNWPQGQMLREFTLLLDPPAMFAERKQVSPQLATTSNSTQGQANPSVKPAEVASKPQYKTVDRSASQGYGPTQVNDTLWDIAERFSNNSQVSHEQMMMALYEANPDAFYQNNVNSLKVGKVLKQPSAEQINSYSQAQAKKAFYDHYQEWKAKTETAQTQVTSPQKTVEATVKDEKALTLLTPDAKLKAQSAIETNTSLINSPELANEVIETLKQENDELKDRLLEMEQQLITTQKLLDLQSQQLAQMQNAHVLADNTEILEESKTSLLPGVTEDTTAEQPLETVTKQGNAEQVSQESAEITVNESADKQVDLSLPNQPIAQPGLANVSAGKAEKSVEIENKKSTQPGQESKVTPTTPAEESFELSFDALWKKITADPINMGIAGLGALALALVGIWTRRRFQVQKDPFDELAAKAISEKVKQNEAGQSINEGDDFLANTSGDAGDDSGIIAESSFLSEFTPVDFDTDESDSDEIDPVAEADVYLAYGRYQQAEELIRSALESTPDRQDCQLKLLEIFYAAENASAFGEYALELKTKGADKNNELWSKVTEMGGALCPNHAAFTSNATSSGLSAANEVNESVDDHESTSDITADLATELDALEISDEYDEELETNSEFDVDLNSDNESVDLIEKEEDPSPDEIVDSVVDEEDRDLSERLMDFDIDLGSLSEKSISNSIEDDDSEEVELAGNEVEFDIGEFNSPLKGSESLSEDELLMDTDQASRDEKIEEIDFFSEKEEIQAIEEDQVDSNEDVDDFLKQFADLDDKSEMEYEEDLESIESLEIGEVDETPETLSLDDSKNESDNILTDLDEIETKLDLAKAYVDMQDNTAAADMLEEIKTIGSKEQIKEAEELLQKLHEMRDAG